MTVSILFVCERPKDQLVVRDCHDDGVNAEKCCPIRLLEGQGERGESVLDQTNDPDGLYGRVELRGDGYDGRSGRD